MKSRSILILIIITLFYSCSSKNDGLIGLDNFTELNSQSEGSGTFPFVYNSNTNDKIRAFGSNLYSLVNSKKIKKMVLDTKSFSMTTNDKTQSLIEGIVLGSYKFEDYNKSDTVMDSLDSVNGKFGTGILFFGAQGIHKNWKMRADRKSASYTTKVDNLPRVT